MISKLNRGFRGMIIRILFFLVLLLACVANMVYGVLRGVPFVLAMVPVGMAMYLYVMSVDQELQKAEKVK